MNECFIYFAKLSRNRSKGAVNMSSQNAVYATLSARPSRLQTGLSAAFFRAFVCSFLANAKSAKLVLFVSPTETADLLLQHLHHPRLEILHLRVASGASIQHSRYTAYLDHLRRQTSSHIVRVALVDALDIVFQKDPFDFFLADEMRGKKANLYVTEETRDYTLGRQASNALWVKELYGDDTLSKLSKHPVLCSGYTMGHASPIRDYLRAMDAEVTRLKAEGQIDRLMQRVGHSMGRGFDQGVHNALVRFGWLANSTTVRALLLSDGPVLHGNGARNKRQFTFDGTTLWTRPTAKTGLPGAAAVPYAVAHQFGKMRPIYLQKQLRKVLTCRVSEGPRYCRSALCADATWLGGSHSAWNRSYE